MRRLDRLKGVFLAVFEVARDCLDNIEEAQRSIDPNFLAACLREANDNGRLYDPAQKAFVVASDVEIIDAVPVLERQHEIAVRIQAKTGSGFSAYVS